MFWLMPHLLDFGQGQVVDDKLGVPNGHDLLEVCHQETGANTARQW